ncbi:SigE family RNA polymerase sigma factor [Longispora sp. K20-0274]|uniref:SigE family RNA polymerase sigma factor n=1 Tax=Longispora sp. K20-0274 TaxID=3088255 RepID=UPI003999A2D5
MAGAASFDEFVTTCSARLLRLSYGLTRDHALAEDLLQTALARSWKHWGRIADDPEPYVRRVLVNTHNSWWRRRWTGERPAEYLPDRGHAAPQDRVADRDEVWRALGRLPRQQRAVLVLRYMEDLSEAQIAETLAISPGSVKNYAAKGLAKLRLDPTLRPAPLDRLDLRDTLVERAEPPVGTGRLAGVRTRIREHRRRRLLAVGAVCVVVLALVLGYLTAPGWRPESLPPGSPRSIGFPDYHDGYHLLTAHAAPLSDQPASFTWIPSEKPFAVFPSCQANTDDVSAMLSVLVNGHPVTSVSCHTGALNLAAWREPTPESVGISPGVPAVVTYSITEVLASTRNSAPPLSWKYGDKLPIRGSMSVAIGEPVPFERYPLPPRPRTLTELTTLDNRPTVASVTAGGQHSATFAMPSGPFTVRTQAQTPGTLRIAINGIPVKAMTWWNYDSMTVRVEVEAGKGPFAGSGIEPGSTVTVTVESEHMTGDWYVRVG